MTRRFAIGRITSIDIDPACAPVAECLNARHAAAGRFEARTADMLDVDYMGRRRRDQGAPTLIINTSSEHLAEFDRWFARIPAGPWLALQSNDYFACDEHVNSVASLAAFQEQAPLAHLRFAGERRLRRYTRFMLIGRK